MRLSLITLVFTSMLAACASPYGNFIKSAPTSLNDKLVADTVKQLVALYPPASTHFEIDQPTSDGYGNALVKQLRVKGYAVAVKAVEPMFIKTHETTAGALRLRYVLDAPANLYRLTVSVDHKTITRAFVEQNNMIIPAGAWVQKEQ